MTKQSWKQRDRDCFAPLAMTGKGMSLSLRGAQRRSNPTGPSAGADSTLPNVMARSKATKQFHITHCHCEERSDEAIS